MSVVVVHRWGGHPIGTAGAPLRTRGSEGGRGCPMPGALAVVEGSAHPANADWGDSIGLSVRIAGDPTGSYTSVWPGHGRQAPGSCECCGTYGATLKRRCFVLLFSGQITASVPTSERGPPSLRSAPNGPIWVAAQPVTFRAAA